MCMFHFFCATLYNCTVCTMPNLCSIFLKCIIQKHSADILYYMSLDVHGSSFQSVFSLLFFGRFQFVSAYLLIVPNCIGILLSLHCCCLCFLSAVSCFSWTFHASLGNVCCDSETSEAHIGERFAASSGQR